LSQSAGRSPLLLAGLVIFFTVLLGLAAFGLNRIVNPPVETFTPPCPAAPSGHPKESARHSYSIPPGAKLDATQSYTAVMCTTRGVIRVGLRQVEAPTTVKDFVFLVNNGYYDGLTLHRVCPNPADPSCGNGTIHIAQGGDPNGDGTGRGPGFLIPDETPKGGYFAGTVALARPAKPDGSKLPNSSGGQFFINTASNNFAPDYNLFGDITSGLAVSRKLVKGDRIYWMAIETRPITSSSPGGASPSAGAATPSASNASPSPS
jgi:cyclophilin family peptidyl-prolyl cis-trans isomerase